jgi:hypothetical protein
MKPAPPAGRPVWVQRRKRALISGSASRRLAKPLLPVGRRQAGGQFAPPIGMKRPLRRLLLPVKNNVGNDGDGLAYKLDDTFSANGQPVVRWEADPVAVSADEALRADSGRSDADTSEVDEAKAWLESALADGPQGARHIIAQARHDGIAKRTLDRAKKAMGVVSEKGKGALTTPWTWRLPGTPAQALDREDGQAEERPGAPQEDVATFGGDGNLRQEPRESGDPGDSQEAESPEDCHATRRGKLHLDADRPGPLDLLPKDCLPTYKAVYEAHHGEPSERHAAAWRVAVGGRDREPRDELGLTG